MTAKGVNIIMPSVEASKFVPYEIEDAAVGGFWLVAKTSEGDCCIFLSPKFVKEEVLPRLEMGSNLKKG